MLEAIEKLLVLQDRDRRLVRLQSELATIEPERKMLQTKVATTQATLDAAKRRVMHLESERKKLELEVEARKQLIEKYSFQQFQTRKNEEYRALTHEIDTCKAAISELEDQQLELMEQGDTAQAEASAAAKALADLKHSVDKQLADLAAREANLKSQLDNAKSERERAAAGIDESLLPRYERLRKSKGETVVVGIDRGVCGGCHMKIPAQVVVHCRAAQEIPVCPNCGRILYYTRDMVTEAAE
jgi:hypothetical protein